jgi:hypothetical protein
MIVRTLLQRHNDERHPVALSAQIKHKLPATVLAAMICATALSGFGPSEFSSRAGAAARTTAAEDRGASKSGNKSINLSTAAVESGVTISIDKGVPETTVRAALRLVRLDLDNTFSGWTVEFKAPRTGYLGLTLVKQRKVEVYLRSGRSVEGIAHDLSHELGHVADVTFNTNDDRSVYLANRGLAESTPWWTCNSCGDLQVGAGDFAETFAALVGPKFKYYSEVGPRPSAAQLAAITDGLPSEIAAAIRAGGNPQATPIVVAKR